MTVGLINAEIDRISFRLGSMGQERELSSRGLEEAVTVGEEGWLHLWHKFMPWIH